MKSINQIFKHNPDLKNIPEVKELIEYCNTLEEQLIDNKQEEQFSFEDKLTELVRDIFNGIKDVEKQKEEHIRFGFESPDYEVCVKNLKEYLMEFSKNNKFKL